MREGIERDREREEEGEGKGGREGETYMHTQYVCTCVT